MGMASSKQLTVMVTGFHNKALAKASFCLEELGYQIVYPKQDLDVITYDAQGETLYQNYGENIEVLRLNEEMLEASGMRWWSVKGPIRALLDPQPLLDKFSKAKDIAMVDPRFCVTMPAYKNMANALLFFVRPADAKRNAIEMQLDWGLDYGYWFEQQEIYENTFKSYRVPSVVLNDDKISTTYFRDSIKGMLASRK